MFQGDIPRVSYGSSVVYAVADSEEEARQLALVAPISCYGHDPEERKSPPYELGAPTRVVDVPYAEIYEWSE